MMALSVVCLIVILVALVFVIRIVGKIALGGALDRTVQFRPNINSNNGATTVTGTTASTAHAQQTPVTSSTVSYYGYTGL